MPDRTNTPDAAAGVTVRRAVPADTALIAAMVVELADYERLAHQVRADADRFRDALFGASPRVFCDLAERDGVVGGMAVWFYTFSTFEGRHGIYLEDLYVRPAFRRAGLGRALLGGLARRCVGEDLARLEWAVLDWNTPAISFYRACGAVLLEQWTTCRISGDAMVRLGNSPGTT